MINMIEPTVTVNKRDFEDICISALRYALNRHTYVLDATIDFIIKNADGIITERVFYVMMRDIRERLDDWDSRIEGCDIFLMDYECIKSFEDWMVSYGEEKGYRTAGNWFGTGII